MDPAPFDCLKEDYGSVFLPSNMLQLVSHDAIAIVL